MQMTTRGKGRQRRTHEELAEHNRKLVKVSPQQARQKLGEHDYALFDILKARGEFETQHVDARNQLLIKHRGLIWKQVNKYYRQITSTLPDNKAGSSLNAAFDVNDLAQEAYFGLMRAVECFEPLTGNRIATYAYYWIKQALDSAIPRWLGISSDVNQSLSKLSRDRKELTQRLGRAPTDAELAGQAGVSLAALARLLRAEQWIAGRVSLDFWATGNGESPGGDAVLADQSPHPPIDDFERGDLRQALEKTLLKANLNKRERQILVRYFLHEPEQKVTLRTVGVEFNITHERVRQIIKKALAKLRNAPASAALREFLDSG